MGDPKFYSPYGDAPPPAPGKVVALIMGFVEDEAVLRWEVAVCVPAKRLVLAWRAWDFSGEGDARDPVEVVCDFCAAHGVQELQFGPEMLSMDEASTGICECCGALTAYVPWVCTHLCL